MRLAPALIAAALLLPTLAMADDCAVRSPSNVAVSAVATQENGMWQIRVTLTRAGGTGYTNWDSPAYVEVSAGGTPVQRFRVTDVGNQRAFTASFPVDDYVNRARVAFVADPGFRNDRRYENDDCNPADDVVELRLN